MDAKHADAGDVGDPYLVAAFELATSHGGFVVTSSVGTMSTESARDRKERFIKCAPGTIQSGTTDDLHRPQRLPRVDHPARSRGTTHRQIRFLRVGPYGESIRNFACYNARIDPLFLFPSSFKTVSLLCVSRAAKSLGFIEYQVSQHLSIRSNFCFEFLLERFITCVLCKRHRVQRIASNCAGPIPGTAVVKTSSRSIALSSAPAQA